MKYVLDSSVAFKWGVVEIDSDIALRFRDDFQLGLCDLIAPDILPAELAHAVTRAERQGRVSTADGWHLWLGIMADAPVPHACIPLLPRAFSISSSFRIGFYDCLYVALAEREQCEFVTADTRLVTNLSSHFPFVRALSSFP